MLGQQDDAALHLACWVFVLDEVMDPILVGHRFSMVLYPISF